MKLVSGNTTFDFHHPTLMKKYIDGLQIPKFEAFII